jgi:hypothetical protein
MSDKVLMQSPEGEVREVEPTPEALTPLMAAGWHQRQRGGDQPPAVPAEENK